MNTNQKNARIAGLLYLIIALIAPFSMMYVPSKIMANGDATTAANNVIASESLFRLSLVGDSIVFLIEVVLAVLLYILFKPVSKKLSLGAAFARLAMAVVQGINLINYVIVLLLLSGANYLSVFKADQLHALVLLFLNVHEYVVYIWGAFFGLHCLILGYLIIKSGYFPKILDILLGILLAFGGVGYLIESFGRFLLSDNKIMSVVTLIFQGPGTVGELTFFFWLLIKGVKGSELSRQLR